ncbi:MAG TPA: PEP-CTERM sorting domain-containing protein, partial [Chthoniobacterales bacterium]|nr:PEP-CTERM sorting domain-containing protein [Chthoniobacterales bacterium]
NYANLGPAVGQTGSLSQVLSTTPGSLYDLSFWLQNSEPGGVNAFEVFWNGASVLSLSSLPAQNYTNYAVSSLLATGSSTTLEFRYRHDDDFFRLDDISVVPEPSALGFAALGLGLFGLAKYYRVKRHRRSA